MNIFTYGSLMYEPVWRRVVAGEYRARTGRVRGFARRRIAGESYPGLTRASADDSVEGVLYLDVSGADVAALDRFEGEGEDYARVPVAVHLAGGASAAACTYLYLHADRLEESPWEPTRFEAEDLPRFLATYCEARAPR
jgi:gamma-glutamylcyclotransferase (GGCT)/AIG2-like uncharacterized protein YtfP